MIKPWATFVGLELSPNTVDGIPAWKPNSYAWVGDEGSTCLLCGQKKDVIRILTTVSEPFDRVVCAECIVGLMSKEEPDGFKEGVRDGREDQEHRAGDGQHPQGAI